MPHRCLGCGKHFEDGSEEVLEGCPDCDGESFLFIQEETKNQFERPEEVDLQKIREKQKKIEKKSGDEIKDFDRQKEPEKENESKDQNKDTNNKQYKNTKRKEIYEKLGDQFEGVKIIEPGSYELNLTKLYERDQKIIALEEDGRYRVVFPESWLGEN